MGYIINNNNFYTKRHITDKCKEILNNNKDSVLVGDDLNFMIELLKSYPIPESKKLHDIKRIRVGRHSRFLTVCVMDSTGREREVSYSKAIINVTWDGEGSDFLDDIDKDNIIRFGKYEGLKFDEAIDIDPKYFEWLLGESWVWVSVKSKIKDLLEKHYEKNKNAEPKIENVPENFDWFPDIDIDYEPPFQDFSDKYKS